jgi:hypothetical protein
MNDLKSFLTAGCIAALALFAGGCGEEEKPAPAVTGINVTPASLELFVGDEAQLAADATPEGVVYYGGFRWASNDPAVASVQDNGMVTAHGKGQASIITSFGAITAETPVTVKLIRPEMDTIAYPGAYTGHLQGFCTNGRDAIFWSLDNRLIKTDFHGKIIKEKTVQYHHGDPCYHNNRVYIVANHGAWHGAGPTDNYIYAYDAETLDQLDRRPAQEVVYGAGGIGCDGQRFIVVGGSPDNPWAYWCKHLPVYEYDMQMNYVKTDTIRINSNAWASAGVQTVSYADGSWWFGIYGSNHIIQTDERFTPLSYPPFPTSAGIDILEGYFLRGFFYDAASGPTPLYGGFLTITKYEKITNNE